MAAKKQPQERGTGPTTRVVTPEIFKQVYDSPQSLPGKYRWVTSDEDVRRIEKLLRMAPKTIGAPLWVSGDTRNCRKCGRETNWLDIIASGLAKQHNAEMIAKVILGSLKFVNVEAPRAIADLVCYKCRTPIRDLRSFKCHNWAYARPELLAVLEHMHAEGRA
jgi:hypothetical protein